MYTIIQTGYSGNISLHMQAINGLPLPDWVMPFDIPRLNLDTIPFILRLEWDSVEKQRLGGGIAIHLVDLAL